MQEAHVTRWVRQTFSDYGIPLSETLAELPTPQGTEVLVRVGHCGVCHSDVHLHDGYFDLGGGRKAELAGGRPLPFALGHEIEGAVEAVGPEAAGVSSGQRYVIYPWIGCGACGLCLRGDEHLCAKPRQIGIQVDGGYASHVLVPHPRYLLDYGTIAPELAGPYMCSGVTAYSAVKKLGRAIEDGPVLIVGLGGVGMMGLSFVLAHTKHAPLVVEIDPAKRELALSRGAGAAFDPADPAARKGVVAASGGGVAGAIDFVGSDKSAAFAYGALAKGGRLVVAGLIGGEMKLSVPTLPLRGVAIEGNYVGSLAEAREMLALVATGKVQPIPVRTRPLSDAQAALDDLRNGKTVGRTVLVP
jgi:D-arabinose 1-dehydrogenase-like Zn-dependent alcohol dehydrogenase